MNQPPPLPNQRETDTNHLNLLAIFHFVLSGLGLLGLGALWLQYTLMDRVMFNPVMRASMKGGLSPEEYSGMLKGFLIVIGVLCLIAMILNLISGLNIRARRNRVFSLVVAGVNCLQFPFGTVLGIFTIIVLGRNSVRELYNQAPGGGEPADPRWGPVS